MNDRNIKKILLSLIIFSFCTAIWAEGEPGVFELRTPIYQFKKPGADTNGPSFAAGAGTEFYIEKTDEILERYDIYFPNQDDITIPENNSTTEGVTEGQLYQISSKELTDSTYRTNWRLDHGVLVVPFKLRNKDNNISGESTIGYYLGSKSDYLFASGTVFASAGLSVISVTDDTTGESDSHTGYTWSIGYAFDSTDDFQAAVVIGQDRLGGSAGDNWEFEGDTWISFALGFGFLGGNGK